MSTPRSDTSRSARAQNRAPSPAPKNKENDDYTAVVYVHGMGSQKRYEEVSRLVDCFDENAYRRNEGKQAIEEREYPSKILAYLESTTPPDDYASYIGVGYKPLGKQKHETEPYRFHEVYWAPVTAGGSPPLQVFLWMLRQVLKP